VDDTSYAGMMPVFEKTGLKPAKKIWAEVGRGEERKGGKTPAQSSLFNIADIHFFSIRAKAGGKRIQP
jgi:hypothetical protein